MKVYLTSIAAVAAVRRDAAAAQTSAFVGPGRVLGIMRRPPLWAFSLLEGAGLPWRASDYPHRGCSR